MGRPFVSPQPRVETRGLVVSYLFLLFFFFGVNRSPPSDVTSEEAIITLNCYDRAVPDQGFLGTVQIKPVLIHDHTVDQWYKSVSSPRLYLFWS